MDGQPARAPGSRAGTRVGRPPRAGRQSEREAHPVEPRRDDVLGTDIRVVREAIGQHARGRPVGHPPDAPIVLVEHRRRHRTGAPRRARPWPARWPRSCPFGSGAPGAPRSRRRSWASRAEPGRRCRRRRTCPSRGPPRRARGSSRRSVSGSPISLFWLPSFRRVRNAAPRTVAMASFVEVLAMLPVTPTTSGSNRARQPAAIAPSATSPSGTARTVTSPSASRTAGGTGRETTSAAAPATAASARKRWPSVCSPARATNS